MKTRKIFKTKKALRKFYGDSSKTLKKDYKIVKRYVLITK